MPETNLQITDAQLEAMLMASVLPDTLKQKFKAALPKMDEAKKTQLLGILKKTDAESKAFEEAKLMKLAELNKQYGEQMKVLERDESKYAREEFEKFGDSEDSKELLQLEETLNNL